ncbi:MAG: hypothetical protein IJ608_05520 [Lachnospiraceae bacterium]|nr:hypothetical protein [Lachnospiraceae bacterium]
MILLNITSDKALMSSLLMGDVFDIFLLEEASVTASVTYSVDGHINRDFYENEEIPEESVYEFKPWSEVKAFFFEIIKGKRAPLGFKFVFILKPKTMNALMERELPEADLSALKALILTIRNDGTHTTVTTGTSYSTFVMDKEPEKIWDNTVRKYFSDKEIPFEN